MRNATRGDGQAGRFRLAVSPLALVTLASAVLGLVLVFAMPRGLFQGDEGVKLVQAFALLHNDWSSRALPYPGAFADPAHAHFPLFAPWVWSSHGAWYGIYSPIFAAISAVGYWTAGFLGIFLFPWAMGVLATHLVGQLARRVFASEWLGAGVALATTLCTPLLLYGTLHFEHTAAVVIVLGAVLLLSDDEPRTRSLLFAGALIGLGPALRTELYCLPLAIVAFAAIRWGFGLATARRLVVVAAAALAVALAYALWNHLTLGTFNPTLRGHSATPRPTWQDNLGFLYPIKTALLLGVVPWTVLVSAVLIGLLPEKPRAARILLQALFAVLAACFAVVAWRAIFAAWTGSARTLTGLFSASPLLICGLMRGPLQGSRSRLGAACVAAGLVFAATIVALRMPGQGGGLELGSRYLLPAAPLLLVGAAEILAGYRALGALCGGILALLSFAATVTNVKAEHKIRLQGANTVAAVRRSEALDVVTNFWWAPQVLAPLYLEKRIYLNPNDALLAALAQRGVRKVVRVHGGILPTSTPDFVLSQGEILLGPQQVIEYSLDPGGMKTP